MCLTKTNLITIPQWLTTESYGILLMLLSAILYSAQGCFVKYAANSGIPSTQLVFLRAAFQLILTIAFMVPSPSLILHPFGKSFQVIKVVVARGFFGGCGFIFFFFSISSLPLGDAVTLFSLYPVITLFMAKVFLREEISRKQVIAAIASLIGGALIAGPSFISLNHTRRFLQDDGHMPLSMATRQLMVQIHRYNPLGYVTAIIGSFFASSVIVLIRKLGTMNVHTLHLLFSWGVFSVLISILVGKSSYIRTIMGEQPWIHHIPSTEVGIYILLMCSIGSTAHFLMNYGGKLAPAGLGSIARSSDIVWAYGWEVLFFGKIPKCTTLIGVVMVLFSLCLAVQTERKEDSLVESYGHLSCHSECVEENVSLCSCPLKASYDAT